MSCLPPIFTLPTLIQVSIFIPQYLPLPLTESACQRFASRDAIHCGLVMTAITTILSQYELLLSVCQRLSSADIVHLAATCKTHRAYIASQQSTTDILLSKSICDGTGIVAQARVFGHWKGDTSKATYQCLGADSKSCSKCGAKVCDVRCTILN